MKRFSEIKKINEQEIQLNKEEKSENEVTKIGNEEVNSEETKSDPSKFFSKIFESRQMAHIYHLQVKGDTGSHASHTALNNYYDNLLLLLDELIETYQGQYDIVENYELIDTKDTKSKDKIQYFTEFNQFIKETRNTALSKDDTHLQNIIDEIVALTFRLIYKLKFNK
jgi:hypothetical protein